MDYIDIIIIGFLVISISLFLYVLISSGNYKERDKDKNIRDKAIKINDDKLNEYKNKINNEAIGIIIKK